MTYFSRADIGLQPARGKVLLDKDQVEGIVVHWPGMTTPLGNPQRVMSALRAWQHLHMNTDQIAEGGASDIAYQLGVDQGGNTYQLRGLRYRSGANGDRDLNERFGAILCIVAIGEKPSEALIRTVRRRIGAHRRIFVASRDIVGHGEIRPGGTQCPGDRLQALIDNGTLNPTKYPTK